MPTVTLSGYECANDLLPPVCVICGAAASTRTARTFFCQFSWDCGVILTRKMSARMPVCRRHAGYWRRRALAFSVPLLGLLAAGVGWHAVTGPGEPDRNADLIRRLCVQGAGLFIVWLIAVALVYLTGVRATEITGRTLTLSGVDPRFVAALAEDRARGNDRLRAQGYGDARDDYDDRPGGCPPRDSDDERAV